MSVHQSEGPAGSAVQQDLPQQCIEDDDSCRVDFRTSNDFFFFPFFNVETGLSRMLNAGAHSYHSIRFMIIFIT